jgi:hypothetical protein
MHVKFNPRCFARGQSRALRSISFASLVLALACGEPEDADMPDAFMQGQSPATNTDAASPDTGVVGMPSTPDTGVATMVDAGVRADSGPGTGMLDAMGPVVADGGGMTTSEAGTGSSEAGTAPDAGDAGAPGGDGGACTSTYENFGRQFMTTYCTGCHMGARAPRMVMLDTLANVMRNKTAVKRVAVTMTIMPESGPKPTAAEREKLGQWLDCGPM